jgi:uncharacterized membrane protein YcaP (DUF421 family)
MSISSWFFQSWQDLGRIVVVGVLAYIALVFLLRISGKRTLTKMNAFDMVITFALGSTLASVLLTKDVTLIEGIVAFTVLIFLQYIISYCSIHSEKFRSIIKSQPTLLFYRGQMIELAMKEQRISPDEISAAIRAKRVSQLQEVEAVILETNGSFSVILKTGKLADTINPNVPNYPPRQMFPPES